MGVMKQVVFRVHRWSTDSIYSVTPLPSPISNSVPITIKTYIYIEPLYSVPKCLSKYYLKIYFVCGDSSSPHLALSSYHTTAGTLFSPSQSVLLYDSPIPASPSPPTASSKGVGTHGRSGGNC